MGTPLYVDPSREAVLVVDHDRHQAEWLNLPVRQAAEDVIRRANDRDITVEVTGIGLSFMVLLVSVDDRPSRRIRGVRTVPA